MKRLIRTFYKWCCERARSKFGPFVDEYPKEGWIVAGVLLLLFGGVFSVQVDCKCLPFLTPTENVEKQDGLVKSRQSESINRPQVLGVGGPEHFLFDTGYWRPNKSGYVENRDGNISLKEGNPSIFFEYSDPVPPEQTFKFSFAPVGKDAMNLEFGRPEFYKVTIGDNDYKTVTLRAAPKIGAKMIPVEDFQWANFMPNNNPERPYLRSFTLDEGEEVDVTVHEKMLDTTGEFEVRVFVSNGASEPERFTYNFKPVSNWRSLDDIFFGLVDFSDGTVNQTSVYFTEPPLHERIND